ncbi:MAG: M18 family aminopeptidase [Lachnospiraceae bacterium]|nr:M18 family aminopeptidase [Lachnospiraceae bacterium]
MENIDINSISAGLSQIVRTAVSPYHTASYALKMLTDNGFKELLFEEEWKLERGGRYVVKVYGSTVAAFTIGDEWDGAGFRLVAAHNDFPCIKLKPSAQIEENNYIKCNAGIYGGAILNTWLDRPLSAAGRVMLKDRSGGTPAAVLVDFARPLFIIPNLAIHMNREVNKGVELNRQKDMLPVLCTNSIGYNSDDRGDVFLSLLAQELKAGPGEILAYDLCLYPVEEPVLLGADNSLFSAGRLDNLTSVQACINATEKGTHTGSLNITMLYDNEEIGSSTKQGAGSVITRAVIERIYNNMGYGSEKFWCGIASSAGLSVDVAHAIHPNYPEKSDITNKLYMNKGFAIKTAIDEKYASDLEVLGMLLDICGKENIPCQRYVNRSDIAGGSTLGAVAAVNLPVKMLDIGVPVLAMHSARETMGIYDQYYLEKAVESFFNWKG